MVRVFTFASGKGGTGKTTMTINLGTSLAKFGKRTCIMDADIGMANLGLSIGLEDVPVTLHEVLAGKASIHDAIYEGPGGVQVVVHRQHSEREEDSLAQVLHLPDLREDVRHGESGVSGPLAPIRGGGPRCCHPRR